jgi:hypothetical protein
LKRELLMQIILILIITCLTIFFSPYNFVDTGVRCKCMDCCWGCFNQFYYTLGFPFVYYGRCSDYAKPIKQGSTSTQPFKPKSFFSILAFIGDTLILLTSLVLIYKKKYKWLFVLFILFFLLPVIFICYPFYQLRFK